MLRKTDKARLTRRAITSEDRLAGADPNFLPPLGHEVLVGAIATLLLTGLGFGTAALFGWVTGWWNTSAPLAAILLVPSAAMTGSAIIRRRRRLSPAQEERRKDIEAGVVDEITFGVTAAKAFRDPEHGSLAYFLKLDDGRVCFCASDQLPAEGWESAPATIPTEDLPRSRLHLLFGAESGKLLSTRLSGERLTPESTHMFNGREWPRTEISTKLPWEGIEELFAASPPGQA